MMLRLPQGLHMLNSDGYLPAGIHDMSLEEVQSAFVDEFSSSTSRPKIMAAHNRHRAELQSLQVCIEQLIDGSFTSSKVNPGDIDLVCFASMEAIDSLPQEKKDLLNRLVSGQETRSAYLCDAYFCPTLPETHPQYNNYRAQRKYWIGEFGYDREEKPKGIVRLQINPDKSQ